MESSHRDSGSSRVQISQSRFCSAKPAPRIVSKTLWVQIDREQLLAQTVNGHFKRVRRDRFLLVPAACSSVECGRSVQPP